jgi:antirestriction protein ArdC
MPKNGSTGRQYSGVNVLILWGAVIEHGFAGQSWLTFRQALSLGGHVRKGGRPPPLVAVKAVMGAADPTEGSTT